MMLTTAILTTIAVLILQHLGLTDAILKVMTKILTCPQCLVFWSVLAVFAIQYATDTCPLPLREGWGGSVILAAISAYLSNWFILLLMYLQRLFTYLYDKEKDKS